MKTLIINIEKDYSRLSSKIEKKGVKHSGHHYGSTLLITNTHKYVFDTINGTLTISHFDYKNAKTIND